MSAGRMIYISRDCQRKPGDHTQIQMWANRPDASREGKYVIYLGGTWLASISMKLAGELGDEFVIGPGECKPVMIEVIE